MIRATNPATLGERMYQPDLLPDHVKRLLESELGAAPARGVLYNPRSLYALVTKHHNERYGEFILSMRRVRRVLRRCRRGGELLISSGGDTPSPSHDKPSDDSSSDEDGKLYPYRGDDELCVGWRRVRRVLSAYGGGSGLLEPGNNPTAELLARLNDTSGDKVNRYANRHLPPSLQQLGGIVLRPQGDAQRGYVVPTVVLHYATGMAQMAEMYGEDMGAGDLDEWVCRPSEWGVSGAAGSQLRNLVGRVAAASDASEDGSAMPMLAIDTNTASTETLELVAAYCAALAAEHVELDGNGLLNTDALPVYPTTSISTDPPPAPAPDDGDDSVADQPTTKLPPPPKIPPMRLLPVTTEWVQPFPYLSASMLLPTAYPTSVVPNLTKPTTSLYDVFIAVRNNHPVDHDLRTEGGKAFVLSERYGGLFHNRTRTQIRYDMLQRLTFSQQGLCGGGVDTNPFHVTPLEAIFALEYLLPKEAHGKCLDATTPHQKLVHNSTTTSYPSFGVVNEMFNTGSMANGSYTTCVSATSGSDFEFVQACGGVQFPSDTKCGDVSDWLCGGRQVEPRLGYLPYKSKVVGFPAWNGFTLPTTIDQFLANATARVDVVRATLNNVPYPHEKLFLYNTMSVQGPHPDRGTVQECLVLMDPLTTMFSTAPRHGGITITKTTKRSITGVGGGGGAAFPSHQGINMNKTDGDDGGEEEEAVLIRASLARTTDVMKVANFLGMAPLVELCGLVIAILLRGNSLHELRENLRSRV